MLSGENCRTPQNTCRCGKAQPSPADASQTPPLIAVRPEKSRRRAGTELPQRPRASDSAALRPGSPWPSLRAHWSAAPLCLSGLSTMLRTTALLAALCGANALSLTSENWDEMVAKTGKAAFVKFQAPW